MHARYTRYVMCDEGKEKMTINKEAKIEYMANRSYLTTITVILLSHITILAQSDQKYNQVDVYHNVIQLDSLIDVKDTIEVKEKAIELLDENYNFYYKYRISKKLHLLGLDSLATKYITKSAKHGLINAIALGQNLKKWIRENQSWISYDLFVELVDINSKITASLNCKNKEKVKLIEDIQTEDQVLRKRIKKDRIKGKPSITSYGAGYTYFNTTKMDKEIHDIYMKSYKEFLYNDSLNLRRFVDFVLEENKFPSDTELYGLTGYAVLFIHTAKYNFGEDYEQLIFRSVTDDSTIHPNDYGWYIGLKSEYLNTNDPYKFSEARETIEQMTKEEIKMINIERKKIGLIRCPAVVWDKNIF